MGRRGCVVHALSCTIAVEAVRDIRLLALASWPARVQVEFLERWHRGVAALPEVAYRPLDFGAQRRELDAIAIAAEPGHPLGDYLRESAASWSRAAALLEVLGTAQACTESIALFGRPDEALPCYESAVQHDAKLADAHWNLSLLYEKAGRHQDAIRHLAVYRRLTSEPTR